MVLFAEFCVLVALDKELTTAVTLMVVVPGSLFSFAPTQMFCPSVPVYATLPFDDDGVTEISKPVDGRLKKSPASKLRSSSLAVHRSSSPCLSAISASTAAWISVSVFGVTLSIVTSVMARVTMTGVPASEPLAAAPVTPKVRTSISGSMSSFDITVRVNGVDVVAPTAMVVIIALKL